MKIRFISNAGKKNIDILPTITYMWYGSKSIWIGWLFWDICIDFIN